MLRHDLKPGESITIGDVKLTMLRKSGQVCSLQIEAPEDVAIKTSKTSRKEREAPRQETV